MEFFTLEDARGGWLSDVLAQGVLIRRDLSA
jgi:hypothetical protein